jgi:hypothetical protein
MDILSQIGPFAKLSMLVSFVPLAVAIVYLVRPAERKLVLMRPVSLGAIFASICALASAAASIFQALAVTTAGSIEMPRVYAGLAETFVPVFFSFGLLAVAWLLIATGMLRRTPGVGGDVTPG